MKVGKEIVVIAPQKPPANIKVLSSQLAKLKTPEEVLDFERRVSAYEAYMRKAGFSQGDLHDINEHRMRARWRLGQMLAAVERKQKAGPGRGKKGVQSEPGFREILKRLKLDRSRAIEAQRIGWLPKIELERIFREAREIGELVTVSWLVDAARPYWYKVSRIKRHKNIAAKAAASTVDGKYGPFPLIYMDPPWKFEIYSEKGLERTPDQHYPTLSDQEIIDFMVGDTTMDELACDDAVLFMWCTSSNIHRALEVMEGLGFTYKSHAVWDKQKTGLGLVFRNQHEVLLYGTKGDMPGPQFQPASVFSYPRGRHSAKPPEVRAAIEKMYPDFDASTRCELFCREKIDGWTTFGFESSGVDQAAE